MRFFVKLLIGAITGILLLPYLVIPKLSMPKGCDLLSPYFSYSDVDLLIDRTYRDVASGQNILDHEILDSIIDEIQSAETFLVVDFFLWNKWQGRFAKNKDNNQELRSLSDLLADAIIEKRKRNPEIPILLITDPINRLYGSDHPEFFQSFNDLGIPVVYTDLYNLPDPNKIYSKQVRFWSKFYDLNPNANSNRFRIFPNLVESKAERLSFSQFFTALHLKANHRKLLISGYKDSPSKMIIGSFNPSNASSFNSNLAVSVAGPVADYVARSEIEIAKWSALKPENLLGKRFELDDAIRRMDKALLPQDHFNQYTSRKTGVRFISEGSTKQVLLDLFENSDKGTEIDIAMFYLSDRKIVKALKSAGKKGAKIRLILDQNKNAFGFKKMGVPNRSVADELMQLDEVDSIQIHWASAETGGQFHSKAIRVFDDKRDILFLGSSNVTHRSINNFNLEANVMFNDVITVNNEFDLYFESIWGNSLGFEESVEYKALKNPKWMQYIRLCFYRLQEWTQLSTY
ncbi:MAG: phospholipase D-like domain-containing protein [Coraliomargaritaceae bacterium]